MPPHGPAHTGTHTFEAEPDGRLSPLAQLQVLQRRNREWERHLSAAEGAVLGAILDRTVLFQHASGFVRIEKLCELTGYSRPQVKRGLRSLRDRGLIATDRAHGRGLNVTVNLDWKPDAMAGPVPKRLKAMDHGRPIRGIIDEPSDGSPATPLIREPSQGNDPRELGLPRRRPVGAGLTASPSRPTAVDQAQEELFPAEDAGRGGVSPKARPGHQETPPPVARPPLPAEADATATVQARLDALTADRKAKADKARPVRLRSMNTNDWWALWRDAIEAGYPGAEMPCEWSVKQRGVLLGKARQWRSKRHTVGEFVEWCAVNWHRACAAGWPYSLKKGSKFVTPPFPELKFLVWGWDTFVVVFERGLSDERARLSGPEERAYRAARDRGLPEDEARKEAFRKVAKMQAEREVAEAKAQAGRLAAMADRSLAEAARLNALTGAARAADDRPKPTLAERRARLRGRMDPMAMMMEEEE